MFCQVAGNQSGAGGLSHLDSNPEIPYIDASARAAGDLHAAATAACGSAVAASYLKFSKELQGFHSFTWFYDVLW